MSGALKLQFAPIATPAKGVLVLFCEEGLKFGRAAIRAIEPSRRPGHPRGGRRPVQG